MRQATVLIADDDSVVRREIGAHLCELGHTVAGETDSGNKLISLARNLRPSVVVVAVGLADVSGFEVAESLSREAVAPVILIADAVAADDFDRVARCGAAAFLAKPVRPADLGPIVALVIARWQRLRELETEVASLNERMEARKLVGRAKAILMERFNLQERDAFRRIQAQSAALNRPVHEIARAIITAHDVST